jgi:Tfp pilus assembly protein PilN
MQTKLWALTTLIVLVLIVIAFWLGRQFGYSEGANQSAEQLLAFPNANTEVAALRAQLDEIRRSEDRILSVIVASFGAGIGILALINIGVVVVSNYNLANERSRLLEEARELVRRSTEDLKQEVATLQSRANELRSSLATLNTDIENGLRPLRLSEFLRLATNARDTASPDYVESTVNMSRAARLYAEMGQKRATSSLLPALMGDLHNIPLDPGVHEDVLDEMEQALRFVKRADPPDAALTTAINNALTEIENIRDRQQTAHPD